VDPLGLVSDGVREARLLPFQPGILLNLDPLKEVEGVLDPLHHRPLLHLQLMVVHFRHLQVQVQSQLHQGLPNQGADYPLQISSRVPQASSKLHPKHQSQQVVVVEEGTS